MNRPKREDYKYQIIDQGGNEMGTHFDKMPYIKALEDYIDYTNSQKSSVLPSIISTNVESGVCDNFELSKWNVSDHNCKHCGFNRNAHFIADER